MTITYYKNEFNSSFGTGVSLQGNTKISSGAGVGNTGGAYFDGDGDGLVVTNSNLSLGTKSFKLSFDMKAVGGQDFYSVLVSKGTGAWPYNYSPILEIGNASESNRGSAQLSSASATLSSGTINDGNWHSIGLIRDGSSVVFTYDNTVVGRSSISANLSIDLNGLTIGRWQGNNLTDNNFKGYIDNFSVTSVEYTAPVFVNTNSDGSGLTFTLAENSAENSSVGTVTANSSSGKAITYSITAGNTDVDDDGKAAFKINATTGAITVNDAGDLNYDDVKSFGLSVQASDGSLSSVADMTVNLTEATKIQGEYYSSGGIAQANFYDASAYINKVSFVVNDAWSYGYLSSGDDADVYKLVNVYSSESFKTSDDIDLEVIANSWAGNTSDGANYKPKISILDSDGNLLKTSESGYLNFKPSTTGNYYLKVWGDSASQYRIDLEVNSSYLKNLNNSPVITAKTVSLAENAIADTSVGSLTASDADSDTLTYSITAGNTDVDGDGKAAFKINTSTGAITVNDAGDLNYEKTKSFKLSVQASDGSLSSKADMTVNLTDVKSISTSQLTNSATQVIWQQNGHVYEIVVNTAGMTWDQANAVAQSKTLNGVQGHLATITSADENDVAFGLVSKQANKELYTALGGTDEGSEGNWRWVAGPESGTAFQYTNWGNGQPDNATGWGYDQNYLAYFPVSWNLSSKWDDGWKNPSLVGQSQYTALIVEYSADKSEAIKPEIASTTFTLAENSAENSSVGTLSASNASSTSPAYSLTAGNTDVDGDGNVAFKIDATTGAITVNDAGDLDYENTKSFRLTVKASDGSLDSTATATVNLTNVNEAPTGSLTISGTASLGNKLTVVSTLKDPDGAGVARLQWLRDGDAISNATSSTYTVTSLDVGKAISARLSYTDGGGFAETKTSSAVTVAPLQNAGVTISGTDKVTGEDGDTAVFTVKLDKAPVYDVMIKFAVSDTTEAQLSPASLTFTKDNWNTAQTLTVTGVDDFDNDGNVSYNLVGTIVTNDLSYKRGVNISSIALVNNDDASDAPILNNGTPDIDYIQGNNGADRLYGDDSMDEIRGGRGDDRIYGENDDDVLYGDDGNDLINGGYDDDEIHGGNGNDEMYGEGGADTLYGDTGNDYLDGGTGADTMIGGVGNDTYFVDNTKDVIDDQGAATDQDTVIVMATITYKLDANVENAELKDTAGAAGLTGNSLANGLTGNGSKNFLDGGLGNDVLDAGAGNDSLLGGDGMDILIGGLGTDTLNGGTGDDLVDFTDAAAGFVNVNLSVGKASGDGADTLISIEDVIGSDGADTIVGSLAGNEITGGTGADQVLLGQDTSVDMLIYRAVSESLAGERDRIGQFMSQQDKISLSGIDANSKVAGDQAFAFNGTTAKANAVWYQAAEVDGNKATADLIVYADVNGDGKADFEVGMVGVAKLAQVDFVL